jgi:hypothetical protein
LNSPVTKCYDTERNDTKQNETKRDKTLILNNKKYLSPPPINSDFKELFAQAASAGAGRPVDDEGFHAGPWTPELLVDAISRINSNGAGVDLRTVQHWFYKNDKGISAENIRWLARIFGCGDPEATSVWQAELKASQLRLTAKRKEKRRTQVVPGQTSVGIALPEQKVFLPVPAGVQATQPSSRIVNLARACDAMFSGHAMLNLPASVWAGWVILGFLTYIMGVHSVTYSPMGGVEKQVGFFWAPNWTLLELVILPFFLVTVVGLLAYWKVKRRSFETWRTESEFVSWESRVESFSASHWAVITVCFVIVFLIQWSGIHMRALANGDAGNLMMDWSLLAIVRPEVISVSEATVLSMLAFLYTGFICFLFLTGLVLTCTLVQDFYELCGDPNCFPVEASKTAVGETGAKLMRHIYHATLLGIWIATCIKLQAMYLLSDGHNILEWLLTDFRHVFDFGYEVSNALNKRALAHFSSFLLLFSTCFVFAFSFVQITRVLERALAQKDIRTILRAQHASHRTMLGTVGLLIANFFLIGVIAGYSLLLISGILITIYSLYKPMIGRAQFSGTTTSKS